MTATTAELVANHRDFVAYVERRVGDRALAEDIVQDAFAKNLERPDDVRDSAVGWFYRVLRNAIIDRARRAAVQQQRLHTFAAEVELASDAELEAFACKCVLAMAKTLKPEYADAIEKIDLGGMAVKDYAAAVGISASNAGVRVFRAREQLRKHVVDACGTCAEHGCVDCTCGC